MGTVEAWTLTNTEGTQYKATAKLSTTEQATKAINELNGYKLPQLGGSKVFLSQLFKAKFSILSSMHAAIKSELADIQRSFRSNNYLEIKSYPSADKAHPFTTLHIISNTARDVGKAKAAAEKVLNGHTARGGKDIVWHELFLKPEGMAYLKDLGKQHDVFIYRNTKKCILSLYGSEEHKATVESALLKTVSDLSASTFIIEMDENVPEAVHQAAYRRVVGKLGRAAARLNSARTPKTLTIHGSPEDADWVKATFLEESSQNVATRTDFGDNLSCAVCWCEVEEAYKTPCGHIYDQGCFVNQCLSASDNDIPIKCLGASGSCQTVISFTDLEAALTRDQLDKLLENSFNHHIRTRPNK